MILEDLLQQTIEVVITMSRRCHNRVLLWRIDQRISYE
jgi:hypothetical protein